MAQEEHNTPFSEDHFAADPRIRQSREQDQELLPTISLIPVPHPKIPNLYQYCYEYVEPWQWSSGAELVETGRWYFGSAKTGF